MSKILSLTLPDEMYERLQSAAEKQGESIEELVRLACLTYLTRSTNPVYEMIEELRGKLREEKLE
ncbi:MAG: hypothetical protein CVU90_01945 [Firmicutes bacterium HGW-Firmicutes-15]|nr:MAG: hypothetical protein CVU90_01945 [Firmicutes bacterium HGW-Firmicutes-15]